MKVFYAALIGLAAVTFVGCQKENRPLKEAQPLMLIPMHDNGRLSDGVLDKVKLYYHINLTSTHNEPVGDFGRAAGSLHQRGVLSSFDVPALSADDDVKEFYLHFPDGTNDTLQVNYNLISDKEAQSNFCYCTRPQISVSINHHAADVAFYTTDSVPVYVVPK